MGSLLALDFVRQRISKSPAPSTTALHTDLLTDTLYAVESTAVKPWLSGAPATAIWRSKVMVFDVQPSFAWLRLEGPVTSAVVRLYGDGTLYYTTPTITDNEPVRLPAKRFREFQVEVESDERITSLILTSSSGELLMSAVGVAGA